MGLSKLFLTLKGGPGSGNFGHSGRLGKRGGSAPLSNISKLDVDYTKGIHDSFVGEVNGKKVLVKYGSEETLLAEEATYKLSKTLGYNVVPVTTRTKDENGIPVSVQNWVEGKEISKYEPKLDPKTWKQMFILDLLTGNSDRHDGNILVNKGKVIAIDNGNSFKLGYGKSLSHAFEQAKLEYMRKTNGNYLEFSKDDFSSLDKIDSNFRNYIGKNMGQSALSNFDSRLKDLKEYTNDYF